MEYGNHLNSGQEDFLRRFQTSMHGAVERGLAEAQEKVQSSFNSVLDAWRAMGDAKQSEMRGEVAQISEEAAAQYRGRLENITNSWMVATVATLDHQSRDVIAKIRRDRRRALEGSHQRGLLTIRGNSAGASAADCRGLRQARTAEALSGLRASLAGCEVIPLAMAGDLWQPISHGKQRR